MGINQNIHRVVKKGCVITQCNPEKEEILARMAPGQDVTVHAYTYSPLFRWPKIGEEWIVREENGAWILDSIIERQKIEEAEYPEFSCYSTYKKGDRVKYENQVWEHT